MEKDDYIRLGVGAFVLFITMLLWSFFLNSSGVSFRALLGLDGFSRSLDVLLNLNFFLFVIFFPMTIALVSTFTKIFDRKEMYIIIVSSFVLLGLISLLLFSNLLNFWVIGIAFFASLIIVAETSFIKFNEMKNLPFLRVSLGAISQVNFFVSIGIFISTALFVLPVQSELVTDLEEQAISSMINEDFSSGLSETASVVFVEGQRQTVNVLINSPQFTVLGTKEDPDVQSFVLLSTSLAEQINSPEYLKLIQEQTAEETQASLSQDKLQASFDKIKKDIPLIAFFEDFFWILSGLIIASLYMLIGNFFFKPLGAIYGFLLGLFVQYLEKQEAPQI